jgi:hypothetical protein
MDFMRFSKYNIETSEIDGLCKKKGKIARTFIKENYGRA